MMVQFRVPIELLVTGVILLARRKPNQADLFLCISIFPIVITNKNSGPKEEEEDDDDDDLLTSYVSFTLIY